MVVMGKGSDEKTQKALADAKAAAKASGGKTEIVFVDADKVDPKSPIGKYTNDIIGGSVGFPFTQVFTQKQGALSVGSAPCFCRCSRIVC